MQTSDVEAPTAFWDELVRIRLETWHIEGDECEGLDDQGGLLGFFAEY